MLKRLGKVIPYLVLATMLALRILDPPIIEQGLLGDEMMAGSAEFKGLSAEHNAMLEAHRAQDWDEAWEHLETCTALAM